MVGFCLTIEYDITYPNSDLLQLIFKQEMRGILLLMPYKISFQLFVHPVKNKKESKLNLFCRFEFNRFSRTNKSTYNGWGVPYAIYYLLKLGNYQSL